MKPGRLGVICHALLDLFLALLASVGAYFLQLRLQLSLNDGALCGAVLAFAVATFTISAFVCTMNYTGSNRLLNELIQRYGNVFRDRWVSIFTFEVAGSVIPVILMVLPARYSVLTISMALGCLVLSALQAMRSLRLLLALMRVAEMSTRRDSNDEIELAKVEERDAALAATIAERRRQKDSGI